jgi:hypothetical protein
MARSGVPLCHADRRLGGLENGDEAHVSRGRIQVRWDELTSTWALAQRARQAMHDDDCSMAETTRIANY